ncbi:MAG: hypothetical protein Q4A65_07200 [Bacillota bacterium]|nr:hypothetical protein [Bacillota bacterium]
MNRNIDQLDRAIKNTSDIDAASIIKAMRKGYRELPEEMFFQEESFTLTHKLTGEDRLRIQRHVEWGNAPYEEYNGYPQNKNKLTSFGKRVRTRGEQLIADSLHYVGVPNRYEEVLRIGPYVMAPDFTFRDCNMKPFYWEYAGMMDDPAYEQRHQIKLKQYREVGIVPWKNLIVTYDTHGSINMAMVEATIMNDIIPRL